MDSTLAKRILPRSVYNFVRAPLYAARIVSRLGGREARTCPICGYEGRFLAVGQPPRYDAECARCGSLERHRLLYLTLEPLLKPGLKVVHFAPEPNVTAFLRPFELDYLTADIEPGRADRVLNLESIDLPNDSVDMVIANHVLEHVDDRIALGELHRILKSGGMLVATVPLIEGWDSTYENAEIVDPKGRDLHFGQWDHVRMYGRDFRDRIRTAGFDLREAVGDHEQTVRHGLLRGERVFLATKPQV